MLMLKIKTARRSLIAGSLIATLVSAQPAFAGNWYVREVMGLIDVVNDTTGESFRAVSKKAADKQAKILNKIEDKQGKGVYDDGSKPCSDPLDRINC